MQIVIWGLVGSAMALATIRLIRHWHEPGPEWKRARLNLFGIVFGGLMVAAPMALSGATGNWVGVGCAGIAITLFIAAEMSRK
jgi:hypothetical protein